MSTSKPLHPIRRIRDALKNTPEELDLRKYSTAEGFAQLIGRSSSLIRNVECGITDRWEGLATLIAKKTKVSRNWLLSHPESDDPIVDMRGHSWEPSFHLDPLAPHGNMPDWRQLVHLAPASIPDLVAESIKSQLIWELSLGLENGVASMVYRFRTMETYENPAIEDHVYRQKCAVGDRVAAKIWGRRDETGIIKADLESCMRIDLNLIGTETANQILADHGFGWVFRLDELPESGLIPRLISFYRKELKDVVNRSGATQK